MTNEEKCRLIAEFETREYSDDPWLRRILDINYDTNLGATMRAAGRLPQGTSLIARSTGTASIERGKGAGRQILVSKDTAQLTPDKFGPAQAACDALADWIAAHPNDQG